MLIDTHAHVNFNAFKDDADEVIRRALDGSASSPQVWMINVGSQYSTSQRAIEIAERYENGVYAAIGLHPTHANEEEFNYEEYKKLAQFKKVVAVGEVGLDYYHKPYNKDLERTVLSKQLESARELDLPVILHCRNAHNDLINELKSYGLRGVVHCFTGSWEEAQKYLDIGLYLGFNGIIFKMDLDDVIKKTPIDRILIETDCPYLTPLPLTGRNEPIFVKYVAEKIAQLKNITIEEVAEVTTQNAKKLFRI